MRDGVKRKEMEGEKKRKRERGEGKKEKRKGRREKREERREKREERREKREWPGGFSSLEVTKVTHLLSRNAVLPGCAPHLLSANVFLPGCEPHLLQASLLPAYLPLASLPPTLLGFAALEVTKVIHLSS